MEEETMSSMTKDEVIVEVMELLKKNQMDKQAGDVFEMTAMVDMLATKLDQMNHELADMRMQIAKLTLQQVSPKEGRSIKESLSKMVEQAQTRIDNLKEKLSDIKQDIKEKATEVIESAKEKGRVAIDKLSNFFHVKEKLVSMREKVKEGIIETDKTITKVENIGNYMKEARLGYVKAAHTLVGKDVGKTNKLEDVIVNGIPLAKPWKWQKRVYEHMGLHLDAAIDKVDNLSKDVEILKESKSETKEKDTSKLNEHSYEEDRAKSRGGVFGEFARQPSMMVAEEKQSYHEEKKYGGDMFEEYMRSGKAEIKSYVEEAVVKKTEKSR